MFSKLFFFELTLPFSRGAMDLGCHILMNTAQTSWLSCFSTQKITTKANSHSSFESL